MKKVIILFVLMAGISMTSCTYKGACKCGGITVEDEFDSKEDYNNAKNVCEDLGCDWKRVL